MARTTIDFGIDLGTTNSSVAVNAGMEPRVVKNNVGAEYTPSAVWIDKKGNVLVGAPAKERLEADPENARSEFKRQMGTARRESLPRSGREWGPVDLSAEVLKALKGDVRKSLGEEMTAAVITVPAAFEMPQNEATKQAAKLAGLDPVFLLQEPVAAALAYGFQKEVRRAYWLVFDLGGGTFDAAILQVRDGQVQVVNHGGDNLLGGRDIDWRIVEDLLIPQVKSERRVSGLARGNQRFLGAVAKLKAKAEEAKIRLSREESVEISIPYLCNDDEGVPVEFEYELARKDVERLASPIALQAAAICRRVLSEKRLDPGAIDRVVLVGGPTLMPILREILEDKREGLGIPLDFSVDPLTVVAKGAAIFAGTQRLPGARISVAASEAGAWTLDLDYKATGPDVEFNIGGRVLAPAGTNLEGYTIEFSDQERRPAWRSGPIRVSKDGVFLTTLVAEKGRRLTFSVVLRDSTGSEQAVQPGAIPYTVGLTITDAPLAHDLRIGLEDGGTEVLIAKGSPLPAKSRRLTFRQATRVGRGDATKGLKVPIVEGPYRKSGLNTLVGFFEATGTQLSRDLRAGAEVEVRLEVDQSRLVKVTAFIPETDDEFPMAFDIKEYREVTREELVRKAAAAESGMAKLREEASEHEVPEVEEILSQIEREQLLEEATKALSVAGVDNDARDRCQTRLADILGRLDRAEQLVAWPAMVKEAEDDLEWTRGVVARDGEEDEKRRFPDMEKELRRLIEARDFEEVRRKDLEVWRLGFRVLMRQPRFLVEHFQYLEEHRGEMRDPSEAERFLNQGRRAISSKDVEALRSAVLQLRVLLPYEERNLFGLASTLRKG